jgi:predicted DNA-binding transcriptional regulator AlpA
MADEWMTVHDAMELLKVGRSRIYELKNDGTFPWRKAGGTLMLDAARVREYAAREKKPGWPRGQSRSRRGAT